MQLGKGSRIAKIIWLLLGVYAVWELYWAARVGSLAIKWHTHLALYIYLGWLTDVLLRLWHRKWPLKNVLNIRLMFGFVWGILCCAEAFLVFTGIGDTYMERIHYGYVSRYGSNHEDYYRNHKPFETFYFTRPEFTYSRKCNSQGFSDIEWPVLKRKNEKRMLVLGDSFTEGVGAPFDSNCVSILRQLFATSDTNVSFMNAANAGDDPCVNFVCYRDLLLKYKPDIIVQSLSSNDMNTDIATKGGLERFKTNGKIQFSDGPWWEPLYALSYISRLFFTAAGYNELLIKIPLTSTQKSNLDTKAIVLFKEYGKLVKQEKAQLIVVLQPYQSTVYEKAFEYNLDSIAQHISQLEQVKVVSLLPYYLHYFEGQGDSIKSYYWLNDGHHNAKGYVLMANAVKNALDSVMQTKEDEVK